MNSGNTTEQPNSSDSAVQYIRKWLEKFGDSVDQGIARCFRRWGKFVSRRPLSVILFTTVFAILGAVAFFAIYAYEGDNTDLFTPDGATSFNDRDYVEALYGTDKGRARVVCTKNLQAMNEGYDSLELLPNESAARESIQELFAVYKEIQSVKVNYKDKTYGWTDICFRSSETSECQVTSILDVWDYNEGAIMAEDFLPLKELNADEPLNDRFGWPLFTEFYLGRHDDVECKPDRNRTCGVETFAILLNLKNEKEEINGEEYDPRSLEWSKGLADHLERLLPTMHLACYFANGVLVVDAAQDQLQDDIQLLAVGYILVLIYTNIVLFKNSRLFCKMHLSMASILGIGFALMSAFGVAQVIGVKFNPIVQVLPFLIIGLGLDDTFVIVGAYQKVPYDLPVAERISRTLERAGSSIFVTSATDSCAFLMGVYTRLPALRSFCVYAALSIIFDFLFQVTFFIAFLVIEARREARYRDGDPCYGISCCCSNVPLKEEKVTEQPPRSQEMKSTMSVDMKFQRDPNNGSQSTTSLDMESQRDPNNGSHSPSTQNASAWKKIFGKGNYDPESLSFSSKLAGTYIPAVTLHPVGRIAVLIAECGLLTFAIYGCTNVKMEFKFLEWFVPEDTALETAFDLEKEYFYGDQRFFSVYTKEAAGGDYFYHQDELAALKTALESDPYVAGPIYPWYNGYLDWLQGESDHRQELVNGTAPDVTSFNTWLLEYLSGPDAVHNESVIFSNGPNRHVVSSKIDAITVSIEGGPHSIRLVDSLRDSVGNAAPSLRPIAYCEPFIFYDGYRVIIWETIRNVLLAGVGVFIMNLIVLANFSTALIVVSMVGLTDLVVLGYMWYVDEYFSPLTAVNLVLIVGIAVDYSAHIAHSFMVLPGDRISRAKGALEHIGGEVISGAFTTWLGILILGFAQLYWFRSFFKLFFAIIVTGAWHGLILLPVVFSFIGAAPYASRTAASQI